MLRIASLLPALPPIKILDIGAMDVGEAPYQPLLDALPCEVLGFEPVEEECRRLNASAKPGFRFLPHVIGDGSDQTFHECAYAYNSSLLEPDTDFLGRFTGLSELFSIVETRPVRTRRLDDIPEAAGTDLLKMDVQGGELMVLQGADRTLRDALLVHTEACFAPMYRKQPLFADIDRHLRERGFAFHMFVYFGGFPLKPLPVVDEGRASRHNQLLWCDVIYVRDYTKLDVLAQPQLLKLAAILHENCKAYGLASAALGEYDRRGGTALQAQYLSEIELA
jgi:FkbM family methyltransferase